jgi:hypothetical protein
LSKTEYLRAQRAFSKKWMHVRAQRAFSKNGCMCARSAPLAKMDACARAARL